MLTFVLLVDSPSRRSRYHCSRLSRSKSSYVQAAISLHAFSDSWHRGFLFLYFPLSIVLDSFATRVLTSVFLHAFLDSQHLSRSRSCIFRPLAIVLDSFATRFSPRVLGFSASWLPGLVFFPLLFSALSPHQFLRLFQFPPRVLGYLGSQPLALLCYCSCHNSSYIQ